MFLLHVQLLFPCIFSKLVPAFFNYVDQRIVMHCGSAEASVRTLCFKSFVTILQIAWCSSSLSSPGLSHSSPPRVARVLRTDREARQGSCVLWQCPPEAGLPSLGQSSGAGQAGVTAAELHYLVWWWSWHDGGCHCRQAGTFLTTV